MSNEEINYWLETFEETRHGFMSKDDKTLSFYDTFKTMKDLQNNWNELNNYVINSFNRSQDIVYLDVLEKMQELQGDDKN